MLINRVSAAVVGMASDDITRGPLQGVRVTPRETVATNGHMLAHVTAPAFDEHEFPRVAGLEDANGAQCEGVTLERETVKAIAKLLPRKLTGTDIRETARVCDAAAQRGDVAAGVMLRGGTQAVTGLAVEGQYVDWSQVMPKDETFVASVHLNAKYLREIAAAVVSSGCGGSNHVVKIELQAPEKPRNGAPAYVAGPVRITSEHRETGQKATFLVMPVRP